MQAKLEARENAEALGFSQNEVPKPVIKNDPEMRPMIPFTDTIELEGGQMSQQTSTQKEGGDHDFEFDALPTMTMKDSPKRDAMGLDALQNMMPMAMKHEIKAQ